ncbi:uncharacterized protein LOC116852755 [Odontomachus brunneus]|uniref:uncharacterized protein LOC116852755 n=1 Tax=Odontomachus brunneus TaxID=486640 RepID=UPI0013F23DC1|nr:uncharacterized protein LOC116852755 [Odontomachus brunneus]
MEDFVSTRASHIKRNYVSVSYENPKKKTKLIDSLVNTQKLQKNDLINSVIKSDSTELRKEQKKVMKKARYDIIKLGMTGFEKGKARKTKVELSISLGAVAPKNRMLNYKKLKIYQKMDEKKIKQEEHASGLTNSLLKHKHKKICKRDSDILGIYGKIPKNTLHKQKNLC